MTKTKTYRYQITPTANDASSSCHVSPHLKYPTFWEVYPILCNLSLGITVYASTLIIPTRLSRIPHPVETFQTTLAGHTGGQKNQPSLMEKIAWIHDIHLTQNVGSIIRWLQKMCPVQPKKNTLFLGGVRMVSWRHQNKLLCRLLFLFSVIGLLSVVCRSPTNNP